MHTEITAVVLRSILLLVVIIQLAVMLFMRNKQPLKSRSQVPFLCLLCFSIMMGTQIATSLVSNEQITVKPFCLFVTLLDVPFYGCINILMALQASRYFLINNMNKFKEHVSEKAIDDEKIQLTEGDSKKSQSTRIVTVVSFRFKMFKLLSSPIFTYFIIGLFLFLFYAIKIPLSIFSPCPSVSGITLTTIVTISIIVCCTVWEIIIWLQDIIVNIKFVLRPWRFFIVDDPYYFRLELMLWIFYIVVAVALNGIKHLNQEIAYKNTLYQDIIDCVSQAFQMFFFSGLILMITIVKNAIHKYDNSLNSKVEELLKNPDLRKLFIQFAKKEWSVENV